MSKTKSYFASDFHLGIDAKDSSRLREAKIIRWLDQIARDAKAVYLVGDLFDFWFEYKSVVPKAHFRFLSKLDQLVSDGIALYLFTGNHDMWMFDYLETELGIEIIRQTFIHEIDGKVFYIAHGDGLGPGDASYKLLKKIFASKTCQWLFARIHPNLAFRIARSWSKYSRKRHGDSVFLGAEKERLIQHSVEILKNRHIDYFVFGHRHLPILYDLGKGSTFVNLGDWLSHYSYAVFDGKNIQLKQFDVDV